MDGSAYGRNDGSLNRSTLLSSRASRSSSPGILDRAANLAISARANVKAIQRMLGHTSAATTLDVYYETPDPSKTKGRAASI
jgi:integrase